MNNEEIEAYKQLLNRFNLAMYKLDQIAFWVNPSNGMDVHGAIGRIQDLLLGTDPKSKCQHLAYRDMPTYRFCPKCGEKL